MRALRALLSDPLVLALWAVIVALCLAVVVYDLRRKNTGLMPLMKGVWALTVLYSGPLGLLLYWTTGRKWIRRDSLWRRAWRSDAHCYSGCGAGEILGVSLMVGLLAAPNLPTAGVTFLFAYLFGFALTVGPLVQSGVAVGRAVRDALLTETPSITVMEVVAIGADLWLAEGAGWNAPLFWGALILSLTLGLLAAYPVNVALIHLGVKEGMMNPQDT